MVHKDQEIVGKNCVKDSDGNLSLTDEEKMKTWDKHYNTRLNEEIPWSKDLVNRLPSPSSHHSTDS